MNWATFEDGGVWNVNKEKICSSLSTLAKDTETIKLPSLTKDQKEKKYMKPIFSMEILVLEKKLFELNFFLINGMRSKWGECMWHGGFYLWKTALVELRNVAHSKIFHEISNRVMRG